MIKPIKRWLIIPLVTMAASIVIVATLRPVWGTDFTGGSLLEGNQGEQFSIQATREVTERDFDLQATVQVTRDRTVLIRTTPLNEERHQELLKALKEKQLIGTELRFESIGPTIGQELRRKAWMALLLAIGGIIIYLAYSFRRAMGAIASWKFGVAATYALVHDLLFVTAIFVVLGRFFSVTIDTLFVTAMLSIMGYSVNDTIVIFDRLREQWAISRQRDLLDTMDFAVLASLMRSLNTSITIALVLIAMLVFGGTTIRWFIVALLAGTVVGTYSSIFVATPALFYLSRWQRR